MCIGIAMRTHDAYALQSSAEDSVARGGFDVADPARVIVPPQRQIRSFIEKHHYDNAVDQTIALGNRIAEYDYFSNLEDLEQEMQLVVSSRPDFRQIDVYENQQTVPRLVATTASGTANLLSAWDDSGPAITTGATSSQINRNDGVYW